VGIKNYFT